VVFLDSGPVVFVQGGSGSGWNRFIACRFVLNRINELLPDDKLTIYVEVFFDLTLIEF